MSNDSASGDWCTIESDPGVFTELIKEFGVKNVQVTELWSMDSMSFERLVENVEKVYGLIFLFKWENDSSISNSNKDSNNTLDQNNVDDVISATSDTIMNHKRRKLLNVDEVPSDLFFARQVIHNACATQAMLSILFNIPSPSFTSSSHPENDENNVVTLGNTLEELKSFMMSLPPDIRGEMIGASDTIRTAHNSFAQRDMFGVDKMKKHALASKEDVFHFIAYVPHIKDQIVYELDGLQPGPVSVGAYSMDTHSNNNSDLTWLDVAREAIQQRIDRYSMNEIKFNLMAVCKDQRLCIQSKIKNLMEAGVAEGDEMLEDLRIQMLEEETTRQRWKEENDRRRHNYLPFVLELLRAYAQSGKLPELIRKAQKMELEEVPKMK